MDAMRQEELHDITQLAELTSDALAICSPDGSVIHANARLVALTGCDRANLIGSDIKDVLFTDRFERAGDHKLPLPLDGTPTQLMLKLVDGSFVPVEARAIAVSPRHAGLGPILWRRGVTADRILVVVRSLESEYVHERQMRRVMTELQSANKRLSGTLSVIMATVGAHNLPALLDAVLNELVDALDADGTTFYFSEGGGFKLRGISDGLARDFVPEFIPYGAGVPTYVLREGRSCRLTVQPPDEDSPNPDGAVYDIDRRVSRRLRMENMPPFKTMIAVPVFFGQQVLGVIEVGWKRHLLPRQYDVNVLEVICDYLSIELMSLVTTLRSQRSAELTRSIGRVHDLLYSLEDDRTLAWTEISGEVRRMLACHICPVVFDRDEGCYVIDYEGKVKVVLPGDTERIFFSATAPARRSGAAISDHFQDSEYAAEEQLDFARLTRIDQVSWASDWLAAHDLPSQGVFIDRGVMVLDADGEPVRPAEGEAPVCAPEQDDPAGPPRMFLILRDANQEPIDDVEYDYLVRLAHDFELYSRSAMRKREDRHIAQALQSGMRSELGHVAGITADALYSSATRQALVGGDFYTLTQLPDDQAMMILGDVSGKGIEAASMSALVKTALSAYAWEGASPQRMVRSLNSMLMSFSRVETFATMFIAKIDLRHGTATYCSAGNPPSMLVRKTRLGAGEEALVTNEIELLSTQSGVVGAFEGMAFETGTFSFDAGDVLFMYTDGAIEARDPQGEFFGERRLRSTLLGAVDAGVEGLCQRVLEELDRFCAGALEDDIALVALRFDRVPER